VCDDLPKGWQTKLLKDSAYRFLTLEEPGVDGGRKDAWHDQCFSIQIRDSIPYPLEQDFTLKDGLPLIEHKFWYGDFKQAKLLGKQAHLKRAPSICFEKWCHEDAREQCWLFK
jgi:hypothetical protein